VTDVPPGARCGVDGCEARAEHPEHPAHRCEDHVQTGDNAGGDPADHGDEDGDGGDGEGAETDEAYIRDPGFAGDIDSVRGHYERLETVYRELGTLGDEYPTLTFAGNNGWYQYRDLVDIDKLEAGWDVRARCTYPARDWRAIVDDQLGAEDRAREMFNIASWKQPGALDRWRLRDWDAETGGRDGWQDGEKPTPPYADMAGFGFWCDLDLADKAGRNDLSTRQRATVERAQQVIIDMVADLYGVDTDDIYALDSGGGSYIYGPPEATLALADYCDPDERALLFDDLRVRMRDGFATGDLDGFDGVWPTVTERVDGAADLLDPDWLQNSNRQSKAPGALHHDHDLVVTPLRPRDEDGCVTDAPDFTPTLPTEIDAEAVADLEQWAAGLTSADNRDAVEAFLRGVYPQLAEDADGWRDVVDARLETLEQQAASHRERAAEVKRHLDEHDAVDTEGDAGDRSPETATADGSVDQYLDDEDITPRGAFEDTPVTDDLDVQVAATLTIDVREVAKRHAVHLERARCACGDCETCGQLGQATDGDPCGGCHGCLAWDTSRRSGELTFDPSWRQSNSGQSIAIRDGENGFIDNGCTSGGGPVKLYALGEGLLPDDDSVSRENAATCGLDGVWLDAVRAMREDGYNIPVWVPAADDEHDKTPLAAVREAAVALDICERDEFVEREGEDGGTYTSLPDAETYNDTLDALGEAGIDHGREHVDGAPPGADTPAELSPEDVLDADTTLDRQEAWRAAGAVSPGDLDGAVGLDAADGGWRCPTCGDHVDDVVRAASLAEGALDCCGDPFDDAAEYDRLYASLREDRGAPLPEYIPPTQAVEDADRARGATEALRGWHLLDGLDSTVTTEDPSGGDAVAEIDPTWEDSSSGERIVLFSSGLFYCREHERVLWPLQVVGLEQGLLDDEDDWLQGQAWLRAYALARTEYDAPLPPIVWNDADEAPDPLYLPVLPDAEDLLGEGVTTDGGALDEARQAVADLYTDEVATDSGARNHLLTVLPALGKSYNAVLQAADQPTLYTAKRLELRKEAADRAREHDIGCMHLPTLGETRPPEKVLGAVASHVREHGRSALRDREALLEVAEDVYHQVDEYWPAYEDAYGDDEGSCEDAEHDHSVDPHTVAAGDPCPGCGGTFDTTSATRRHVTRCDAVGEDDSVDLDRAACGCGDGEHGPEWQLAFWTARKLGEKPRDLHVRGETIFDDTPPCCEDDCPYTVAWDRAADPDRPVDLLIGHPVHAYVSGARTRPERTDDDDVYVEDRVVALDEFPGDVYTRKFGDEYIQHARWLAGCLSPAVEDTTDLLDHRRELWRDDTVAAWLDGEASPAVLDALEAKREQAEDDDADDPDWSALLEAGLDVDGDLAALVRRAVRAAADPDRDAEDLLDTATTALRGGREGADALASGAEDGYAHPDAYWLLLALLAPDGTDAGGDADPEGEADHIEDWRATVTAETRDAEHFDLGSDNGRMKAVTVGDRQRFLLDRDHAGAVLLLPPDLEDNTVAGLDATGRPELWEIALGAEFTTTDIHETAAERRAFLRDVLNLRVVQTTPHVHTYSGDPTGKNFGDDVALVDAVADQYGQHQLAQDRLTTTSAPAVVTTKKVENYVGGDLVDAGAARVDHYGDLIGSNRLDEHSVGVILGAEHYGHDAAEKWALLAGEEFEATGRGTDLDYTSDAANALLRRMRDDQVMQSIMRFGRDEEGAVVFAHTAALREDLPVVEDGDVAEAWTQNQQAIAKAAADRQGQPFDVASVAEDDRVDCHRRTVRRVLNQFADLGYLQADRGHATEYSVEADPGTGQVDLDATPELAGGGAGGGGGGDVGSDSGQSAYENTNTWFVWSCDADRGDRPGDHGETVRLGPPRGTAQSAPPG
jgi:hypothetical protein